MTHLFKIALSTVAIIGLSACSSETPTPAVPEGVVSTAMTDMEMDHGAGAMDAKTGDTGQTTGTLVSISPDGQSATITHEAIAGVGMNAMTMGFDIPTSVDLSDYAAGDPISFKVKRGEAGRYSITAICNTQDDGDDCLAKTMDHSGH